MPTLVTKRGDREVAIAVTLKRGDASQTVIDLTGLTVGDIKILLTDDDGNQIVDTVSSIDAPATAGNVSWVPSEAAVIRARRWCVEFEVTHTSGRKETLPVGEDNAFFWVIEKKQKSAT